MRAKDDAEESDPGDLRGDPSKDDGRENQHRNWILQSRKSNGTPTWRKSP